MRIAALGDAHLGRTATTALAADGANQREVDFEHSFTASVDLALAQEPEAILWLGDVFDHPRPSYRSFRVAMAALRRIRDHGVRLVAISGNHDTPRLPGVGNPYAVLADTFPEFHFAHRMSYERFDLPGLAVHAVPQTRTAEDAVEALRAADAGRSLDRVNLLLTHPLVHSVERRYADMNEIEIDDAELRSDLVLLGHYHVHTTVKPHVWYAGSTDTFGFGDDPHRTKGIVVLDTDSGECTHLGVAGQRPLCTADPVSAFDLGPAEVQQLVAERLATLPAGAVARVLLDGIAPDVYRMIDLRAVHDAGSHLLHLKLEPSFAAHARAIEDLPDLHTMAVRWEGYVAEQSIADDVRARVVATGQEYLERAIDHSADLAGE